VQVGDFGFGFVDPPVMQIKDRAIRGNHDNPAVCMEHPNWICDGFIENNIMYIGGENSIDRRERTEGLDWWSDEQLSNDQLGDMIDRAIEFKPSVMVTHGCPAQMIETLFGDLKTASSTSRAFDIILDRVRPKLWIFGHYHRSRNVMINGTQFICCGIDEAVDIDLTNIIGV
jgi:Icc-related predicted phosphoesterase